jgi:threonine dehydrogenase-like Zn-dependent dehydrogenase
MKSGSDEMRTIYVDKNLPRMFMVQMLRSVWPGVIWSPFSPVHVVDMQTPQLPGPKWLRLRNIQCGLCATDLSLLFVDADPATAPAALPGNARFYLGHEVVSEVVEVGAQVTRFKVGDRVVMESRFAGPNCHSQEIDPPCIYCAQGQTRLCENASLGLGAVGVGGGWGDGYTAHEAEVWPVPLEMSTDQASLIEPNSVALHSVLRKPPLAGDHVLVIGAGIIGLLIVQMAKIVEPDCHVTAIARYPHQAEMARKLGADEVLTGSELYPELAEITQAKYYRSPMNRGMLLGGFEVVYDCVGKKTTVSDGLRWARAGGTVVLVGVDLSTMKVDLNPVWYQEVDLIGSHTFGMENWHGRRVHTFDLVIRMFEEEAIRYAGLITHRFPFEQYKKAVAAAMDKRSGSIKVCFSYDAGIS